MLLALDIGNSFIKAGLFVSSPRPALALRRFEHTRLRLPREYAALLELFLSETAGTKPKAVVMASVVRELTGPVAEAAGGVTGCSPLIVSHMVDTGVELDVRSPESVGADRIASAAGALAALGAPVVVVDFGTATTVNFIFEAGVPERGIFKGGAILPGLDLMAAALASGTAQLPRIGQPDMEEVCPALGRDTSGNILSGMIWGSAGAVEKIIAEVERAEAVSFRLAVTGGSARHVLSALGRRPGLYDPDLTLKGLMAIYERNR